MLTGRSERRGREPPLPQFSWEQPAVFPDVVTALRWLLGETQRLAGQLSPAVYNPEVKDNPLTHEKLTKNCAVRLRDKMRAPKENHRLERGQAMALPRPVLDALRLPVVRHPVGAQPASPAAYRRTRARGCE